MGRLDSPNPAPSTVNVVTLTSESSATPNPPIQVPFPWMAPAHEVIHIAFAKTDCQNISNLWCQFERLIGKQDSKKIRLTSKSRPQQVADWMQRHRQFNRQPPIDNVPSFGVVWKSWWKGMQPIWRSEGAEWPLVRRIDSSEKWENLMKGGQNGFLIVLLTLSWWLAAALTEAQRNDCVSALDDVEWVLVQMVVILRESKSSDTEEEGEARGQKRYVVCSF